MLGGLIFFSFDYEYIGCRVLCHMCCNSSWSIAFSSWSIENFWIILKWFAWKSILKGRKVEGREKEKERKRKIFHLLVLSLSGSNGWGWTTKSILISHCWCRGLQNLGPLARLSQAHEQGSAWEVEQPQHSSHSHGETGTTGRSLIHCTTVLPTWKSLHFCL